jgi:hypothetical protein
MVTLVLVAFGVFVLPFAFTTPPPIITRFVATRIFSPGTPDGRPIATAAVRLSEPANVVITVKDPSSGEIVARLSDGRRTIRATTLAVTWDGRDLDGRRVPDGTYALDLDARAGKKKFAKSRKVVVDTTAPQPEVVVRSTPAACIATASGPGEAATISFSAPLARVTAPDRRIGARGSTTWEWAGRRADGRRVAPGIQVIRVVARDREGNVDVQARTCWVSHLDARAVPGSPRAGQEVGVVVAGGRDTPVTLTLRRRLADPGGPPGRRVLGERVGPAVTGPASRARITIPDGADPGQLWLLAATGPDRQALISLGGGG